MDWIGIHEYPSDQNIKTTFEISSYPTKQHNKRSVQSSVLLEKEKYHQRLHYELVRLRHTQRDRCARKHVTLYDREIMLCDTLRFSETLYN